MPTGEMLVNYGNVYSTFILKVTLTPAATATVTVAEQTFTVPGLQLGDQISDVSYIGGAFPNTLLSIVNARVSATNTLALAISNSTAGSLTYPSGSYYLEVNRPDLANTPAVIQ
jgi:hypothetical protein